MILVSNHLSTDPRSFSNCSWWHRAEPELCFDHAPLSQLPVCCQVRKLRVGMGWALSHQNRDFNHFGTIIIVTFQNPVECFCISKQASEQFFDCCYLHQPTEISSIIVKHQYDLDVIPTVSFHDATSKKETSSNLAGQKTVRIFRKLLSGFGLGENPSSSSKDPLLYVKTSHVKQNMWLLYHETGFAQKAWNLEDGWYHPTKASKSLRLRFPEYFWLNFFPRSFCLYLLMTINMCCVFFGQDLLERMCLGWFTARHCEKSD